MMKNIGIPDSRPSGQPPSLIKEEIVSALNLSGLGKFVLQDEHIVPGRLKSMNLGADGEEGTNEASIVEAFEEAIVSVVRNQFSQEKIHRMLQSGIIEIKHYDLCQPFSPSSVPIKLDGHIEELRMGDECVGMLFTRRTTNNYAKIDFILYPDLIIKQCEKLNDQMKEK